MPKALDRLFVITQKLLPARAIGRLIHALSRSEREWLRRPLIALFTRLYAIDLDEAERPNAIDYPSFNALFTRELMTGARPDNAGADGIACPADGFVQQAGRIHSGQLIQAKGMPFDAAQLIGAPGTDRADLEGGSFLTIYLAPHNYHRVHMPLASRVEWACLHRGRLFSVNRATARTLPQLFVQNERLAMRCRGDGFDYWIVMVAALNVGSLSTVWAGELDDRANLTAPINLHRGDYLAHFNLGSTVVLLFPDHAMRLDSALEVDLPLRVGQRIGQLMSPAA